MQYVFQPGDSITLKIGTELIKLKVVADNPSFTSSQNCSICFFNTYPSELTCRTQACAGMGNHYHFELDNQTPIDDERRY